MRWIVNAILFSALAPAAYGQNHLTDFIVAGVSGSHLTIGRMSRTGVVTTQAPIFDSFSTYMGDFMLDADNEHYYATSHTESKTARSGVIQYLDGSFARVRSSTRSPMDGLGLDDDGNVYVQMDHLVGTLYGSVYRYWPGSGRFTTLAPGVQMGLALDVHTGDFVGSTGYDLLRVTRTGQVTTISPVPFTGSYVQHHATGDFYGRMAWNPGLKFWGILRVTPHGQVTTLLSGMSIDQLMADRGSAASPRLIARYAQSLLGVDPSTGAVSTVLATIPTGFWPWIIDRSRNVATVLDVPGKWTVHVSFPTSPGAAFAVAVSVSGTQPGLRLADGRKIPLNVDAVTMAGLTGRLAPMLQGYAGTLSPGGTARAILDVRPLPGRAGIRLWLTAVVLDPSAPLGIRIIADPVGVNL